MAKSDQLQFRDLSLSLKHDLLAKKLIQTENILLIQDLDGVCMGLVKDPLARIIDWQYILAAKKLENHFFVLTNGEHIGKRGINSIVEKAAPNSSEIREKGYYLSGLGAGGVQWQDCYGRIEHPGVSPQELKFLAAIPEVVKLKLQEFCQQYCNFLSSEEINQLIETVVLDNFASPTVNLNVFYEQLKANPEIYLSLQKFVANLMNQLLKDADNQGLTDSFFIHYAPNLGRDDQGLEILRPATYNDSGTTDFQFMLTGAVKEAGVLFILNHYYFLQTKKYPLGADFSVRKAPKNHQDLLNLIKDNFDLNLMPFIMGVGDTVTSKVIENNGKKEIKRGGSDRNFLQLIQDIGQEFNHDNVIVYIDSSAGEVKNRKPLKIITENGLKKVIEGPGDVRDQNDPLKLNVVFPDGYQQYLQFFQQVANNRSY